MQYFINTSIATTVMPILYLLVVLLLYRVKINDISQLKPLIGKARLARCRSRFVVPVISFSGKVSLYQ
jgi:hypothetical protein